MQGWELDSMILVGPFPPGMFYDNVNPLQSIIVAMGIVKC